MTEIKLYKSPWRAIRLIFLSSIFVLSGIWSLGEGISSWLAWFVIIFFGMGYPVGIFHLFDKRPQIIINEIGIFDRTAHKDFINWEIIQDAYLMDIHGEKFISLVVDEQFRPSKKKGKLYRQAARFNQVIGAQELNLSLGQIKIDVEKLTQFILIVRAVKKDDRKDFLRKAISDGIDQVIPQASQVSQPKII